MSKAIANASVVNKLKVKTLLGDKSWTESLKNGSIESQIVDFDFYKSDEISDEFKPMVRNLAYDCGELAIVTHLQAIAYGKPLVLLPFVVSGKFHHKSFAYNAQLGGLTPQTLAGKRVGVRTYSQTTGVWVRGILQNDYGADFSKVEFVTFDDSHLAEHTDPANCVRAAPGKKLIPMLLDGELDAGMLGSNMPKDERLKTLIPTPPEAEKAWEAEYGVTPINHMFIVTKALAESRPDAVRAIFDTLVEARPASKSSFPVGLDGNWKALELISEYSFQQGVIPRRISVDELFADFEKILKH